MVVVYVARPDRDISIHGYQLHHRLHHRICHGGNGSTNEANPNRCLSNWLYHRRGHLRCPNEDDLGQGFRRVPFGTAIETGCTDRTGRDHIRHPCWNLAGAGCFVEARLASPPEAGKRRIKLYNYC
jgi:hypothetical protein